MRKKPIFSAIAGNMRKCLSIRNVFLGLALLLAAMMILLFSLAPPLIPSGAYKIDYSVNGIEYHDGKVYQTLSLNEKSYLYLPHLDDLYRYISIDWRLRKVMLPGVYQEPLFGWACLHFDVPGASINNDKFENPWEINFRSNGVALSNQKQQWPVQLVTIDVSRK
jgi:hypothetical protein